MGTAERLLKLLLRAAGAVCGLAIVAFFMPRSWMAACHEWLGLGAFPEAPIAEYLARLTSGLYAFYGVLLWLLATDVRRFARVITYQAVVVMVLAAAGLPLGALGGMPWPWLIADALSAGGFCAAVLVLQARAAAARRR
jgi:hypothetical protein